MPACENDCSSVALTVTQHKQTLSLLTQDLDQKVEQALACPCLDDLKEGPCGTSFIAAFSCFLKSRADEKVHPPHNICFFKSRFQHHCSTRNMQQHCILLVVLTAWSMQKNGNQPVAGASVCSQTSMDCLVVAPVCV